SGGAIGIFLIPSDSRILGTQPARHSPLRFSLPAFESEDPKYRARLEGGQRQVQPACVSGHMPQSMKEFVADFYKGQRWVSESEPELGLGSVLQIHARTVTIEFKASDATRQYARNNAPLRRVRFQVGATVRSRKDISLVVQSISERDGLIFYHGDGRGGIRALCETELNDRITFNKADERLLAGAVDPPDVFDLRVEALNHQFERRKSRIR